MGPKASWLLKLDRADKHLRELETEIAHFANPCPFVAIRAPRCKPHKDRCWRYLLKATKEPDADIAIVAADAIHNLRTCLDHLAVAIAPKKRKWSASFPIVHDDMDTPGPRRWPLFWRRGPNKARDVFTRAVEGMPAEAIAFIEECQPQRLSTGTDRRRHGLAVLGRLDNADKHRELLATTGGLVQAGSIVTARGQITRQNHPPDGFAVEGIEIAQFVDNSTPPLQEAEVRVEILGAPAVSVDIGIKNGELDLATLRLALEAIAAEIFPALEPFVRR